jgi:AcrR family transcriptional regulator
MALTKNRGAALEERIMNAARSLAQAKPLAHIGLSEIARLSGVSWPTVKRHVGSKEALRSRLVREQPELVRSVRDTRSRLLDAAASVFAHHGYERATLDEVAHVAGLTKGAVYWHFESKAHLFRALLAEYDRREAEFSDAQAERARASSDPEQAIVALVKAEHARLVESPEWARLPAEFLAAGREEAIRTELASALLRRRSGLGVWLRELANAGKLDPELEPDAVALIGESLIRGLLELALVDPEVDLDRAAFTIARLLTRGLGRASARAAAQGGAVRH